MHVYAFVTNMDSEDSQVLTARGAEEATLDQWLAPPPPIINLWSVECSTPKFSWQTSWSFIGIRGVTRTASVHSFMTSMTVFHFTWGSRLWLILASVRSMVETGDCRETVLEMSANLFKELALLQESVGYLPSKMTELRVGQAGCGSWVTFLYWLPSGLLNELRSSR